MAHFKVSVKIVERTTSRVFIANDAAQAQDLAQAYFKRQNPLAADQVSILGSEEQEELAYILTATPKGKKTLYTVKDQHGRVVSTRLSARAYVACSACGSFYFGRLDLIYKGDYAKHMDWCAKNGLFCYPVAYLQDETTPQAHVLAPGQGALDNAMN